MVSLGFLLISLPGWLILKDGDMSNQNGFTANPRTSLCLKSTVDVGALLI